MVNTVQVSALHSKGLPLHGTAPRHKRWVTTLGHENGQKLRPLEPRNLALAANLELEVQYFDSDGAGYIAIFAGQSAELRARDYYDAVDRGALDNRIADAQVVTAKRKPSLSHRNNEGQCAEKAECWRARAGAGMAATLMCGWADEL